MTAKNVDDLIVQSQSNEPLEPITKVDRQDDEVDNKPEKVVNDSPKVDKEDDNSSDDSDYGSDDSDGNKDNSDKSTDDSDDHDDYGTKIKKEERTYTQDEVNAMMRDRFNRTQLSKEQQQEAKQAAQEFKPDENSSDDWQIQLDNFIDKRLDSRDKERQNREYQQREEKVRAEFEDKFTTGMGKYKDFQNVVQDKPITDAMVHATYGFKDPAGFIYAAAKNHAKELDRIARLPNPLQQAMEIGRLEEKMRKQKQATRAARPPESEKGDVTDAKATSRHNIDSLIEKHARSRRR